jgi:methylene-tetrahydromethanopterin dehydrogenase
MFDSVTVTAAARLHLGFLDMNGGLGRRFGSLGLGIDRPVTRLTLRRAAAPAVEGPEAERAARHLALLTRHLGLTATYRLTVHEAIPAHAGLGSGTQLALAIATALRHLEGLSPDDSNDALLLRRGARSGVGLGLFQRGGLIVDGGRGARTATPPVVARMDFPPQWRVIVVLDPRIEGVHGGQEQAAFARLADFKAAAAAEICRLVLIKVLPALAELDIVSFGGAIVRLQEIAGDYFAPAQGGAPYASAAVGRVMEELRRHGARGIGQSSWGPTGFAFAADTKEATRLCHRTRERAAAEGVDMAISKGVNHGALVEEETLVINKPRQKDLGGDVATKNILHMFSPLRHMSPFDVTMALDAGFDSVTPYIGVTLDEIATLVQDAMFARSPRDAVRTAVFIGGKDIGLALDMMDRLRETLLKPFEISAFADPAGSFTTAAAMVACVEKILKKKKAKLLGQTKFVIFGATGPVGFTSGVIAAMEGAEVTLAGRELSRVQAKADEIKQRFGLDVRAVQAKTPEEFSSALAGKEVALCAATLGQQVLTTALLTSAKSLEVAADVNAVPPSGIEGLDRMANGVELAGGVFGIGSLAIGNVKYKTESELFHRMATSSRAISLDFRDAFTLAREIA